MKKGLLITVLLISFISTLSAQTESAAKNEIHLNALTIMALKWVDVSYEYVINEESSAGISFTFKFSDTRPELIPDQQYAITPYYRYYISQQNAEGLFGEVFAMVNGGEKKDDVAEEEEQTYTKYSDGAFGLGAGYKFLSNRGLAIQGYGGIGRNLFDDNAPSLVFRLGVSIGYRF
jgi:hypothetical protein